MRSTARHTTTRFENNSAISPAIGPSSSTSITAAGRLCFGWSQQQPEAFGSGGKKDLRGAYGLHGRELMAWLLHLQQARAANVVLLGILETVVDDFNKAEHRLQLEGAKTGRELPGVVDQVVTMNWVDFDGVPTRSVCLHIPEPVALAREGS